MSKIHILSLRVQFFALFLLVMFVAGPKVVSAQHGENHQEAQHGQNESHGDEGHGNHASEGQGDESHDEHGDATHDSGHHGGEHEEDFHAGEMIIEHIMDDHVWHFWKSGVLYLPVILYTDNGLVTFSSSHLYEHHAAVAYKGYVKNIEHSAKPLYKHDEAGHLVALSGTDFDGKLKAVKEEDGKLVIDAEASVLDLSITKNVASMLLSVFIMVVVFLSVARGYKKREGQAPKGIQSFFEPIIEFVVNDIARDNIGPKYRRYVPYLLTVFFFIWFNNLLGLLPGAANVTGNIAVTLVLAGLTLLITVFSGNKYYWGHIFNTPGVPWWLKWGIPIMPIVEIIGIFAKPFSLMVRLFANITAGHIIILSLLSLIFIFNEMYGAGGAYGVSVISVAFATAMNFLELFVALLQAYIFTMLSAMYFGSAVEEHHDH